MVFFGGEAGIWVALTAQSAKGSRVCMADGLERALSKAGLLVGTQCKKIKGSAGKITWTQNGRDSTVGPGKYEGHAPSQITASQENTSTNAAAHPTGWGLPPRSKT